MIYTFPKTELKNISKDAWKEAERLLANPGTFTICKQEYLTFEQLLAIGLALHGHKAAIVRLHVYHCSDCPSQIREWTKGFPNKEPCSICKRKLTKNNTKYDIELILKYPVQFK